MVILFTSDVVNPPATIYMGRDKHENEDLIRWGWPEDVWFHVDKLSSAHVYLRLNPGQNLEEVPDVLIEDCAQLVKANSIQGCKLNNVKVVYTKWENLNKTGDMDVGQIGFHHNKAVHIVTVDRKNPEIIKRLEKTRQEVEIDYRREREMRDKREADGKKKAAKEEQERLKLDMLKKDEEMRIRSYADVFTPEKMAAQPKDGNDSDDFM